LYAALELWPFEMYAERATTMTVTMTVYARTAAEAKEKAQRPCVTGTSCPIGT